MTNATNPSNPKDYIPKVPHYQCKGVELNLHDPGLFECSTADELYFFDDPDEEDEKGFYCYDCIFERIMDYDVDELGIANNEMVREFDRTKNNDNVRLDKVLKS